MDAQKKPIPVSFLQFILYASIPYNIGLFYIAINTSTSKYIDIFIILSTIVLVILSIIYLHKKRRRGLYFFVLALVPNIYKLLQTYYIGMISNSETMRDGSLFYPSTGIIILLYCLAHKETKKYLSTK